MGFPSLPRIELYDALTVYLRPFRGNVGRAFLRSNRISTDGGEYICQVKRY